MIDSNWFKEKGKAIQKLRKQAFPNDTQKTFAARVGVGLTTIQNLEAGQEGIAWGTFIRVFELLNKQQEINALFIEKESNITLSAGELW